MQTFIRLEWKSDIFRKIRIDDTLILHDTQGECSVQFWFIDSRFGEINFGLNGGGFKKSGKIFF